MEKKLTEAAGLVHTCELKVSVAGNSEGCLWPGRIWLWMGWWDLKGVRSSCTPVDGSRCLYTAQFHNSPSKVKKSFNFYTC